ncbi:hypothetical protein KIPB_014767, partial [Kipferlia bialata]|eukprot:g14767.t1
MYMYTPLHPRHARLLSLSLSSPLPILPYAAALVAVLSAPGAVFMPDSTLSLSLDKHMRESDLLSELCAYGCFQSLLA